MSLFYKTYTYYLKGSSLWEMPYQGIRYFSLVNVITPTTGKVKLNISAGDLTAVKVESARGTKKAIGELKRYINPEDVFLSLPRMATTSSSALSVFYPINFFDFFPNIDLFDVSNPDGLYISQKDVETPLNYYGHTIKEYAGEWHLYLGSKDINTSKDFSLGKLFKASNNNIGATGSFNFIGYEKLQDGQITVDTKFYKCTFSIELDPSGTFGYNAFFETTEIKDNALLDEIKSTLKQWTVSTENPTIYKTVDKKSYGLLPVTFLSGTKTTKIPFGLSTKRLSTSLFDWLDDHGQDADKNNPNYKGDNYKYIFNRGEDFISCPFWVKTNSKDLDSAKDYVKQYDKSYIFDYDTSFSKYGMKFSNNKTIDLTLDSNLFSSNNTPFTYNYTTIYGEFKPLNLSFPDTISTTFVLYNLEEDGTIGKWTEILVGGVDVVKGSYGKVFNGYMSSGLDFISDKQTAQGLLKSYLYGLKVEVIGTITNPFGDASSKPGGGGGSHDGTSDIIDLPGLPPSTILSTGLFGLWNPSITQLNNISNILWTGDWLTQASKLFKNPMDVIQNLYVMPVTPVRGTEKALSLAGFTTSAMVTPVASQYREIDMGSVKINEYWGSFLDYAPYTKMTIFLPYIGEQQLNVNDVMGKTVNVKYRIDFINGTCLAIISADGSVLAQHEGVMKFDIPISSSDKNVVSAALKIGSGVVQAFTGNMIGAASGVAGGVADLIHEDIQRNGSISSNNGYMGVNYVYIRIMRPVTFIPDTFAHDVGFASNISSKLSKLKGFTKVPKIDLSGLSCTDDEMTEIIQLLSEGVYI